MLSENELQYLAQNGFQAGLICSIPRSLIKYGKFNEVRLIGLDDESKSKYLIDLNILIKENESKAAKVWIAASVMTLSVIPFWNSREYHFDASIYGSSGKLVKKYFLSDESAEFIHLFLLPAMPFLDSYSDGMKYVEENIISHLLSNMRNDRLIN